MLVLKFPLFFSRSWTDYDFNVLSLEQLARVSLFLFYLYSFLPLLLIVSFSL
jgi:hypothetical protein